MLPKINLKTTASALLVLLIFIIGLTVVAAGTYFVDSIYTEVGVLDLTVIIAGIFIFVAVLTITDFFARRIGTSKCNDKSTANRLVNTVWFCLAGIFISLGVWSQMGVSPKPSIFWPMAVAVVTQIILYIFASSFVFTSNDPVRTKVWTGLVALLVLCAPSIIIYTFAQLG